MQSPLRQQLPCSNVPPHNCSFTPLPGVFVPQDLHRIHFPTFNNNPDSAPADPVPAAPAPPLPLALGRARVPRGGRGPGWRSRRPEIGNWRRGQRRPREATRRPTGRYQRPRHRPPGMAEGSPTSLLHLSIIRWCVSPPSPPPGPERSGLGRPPLRVEAGGGRGRRWPRWSPSAPPRRGLAGSAGWAYLREGGGLAFSTYGSFVRQKPGLL